MFPLPMMGIILKECIYLAVVIKNPLIKHTFRSMAEIGNIFTEEVIRKMLVVRHMFMLVVTQL